nr:SIR2 family protein [Thermoanaerobacter sp. YS13]
MGADIAGLRLIDRFIGTLSPIFRSSRLEVDMHYNPPGIRGEPRYLEGVAYFTKLHGSLDWFNINRTIHRISIPFGAKSIQSYLDAVGIDDNESDTIKQLMIYPNAAKDRETAEYPYVELFRDFAASICRPNTTLVTYGYSFGDEHINRIIEDMLTIPSTHLIIISRDDDTGRIMSLYDRLGKKQQITILIGDQLADLQLLVDNYLPKSTIDFTTFKIDELIKKILITNSDNIGSNVNSEKETRIEQDEEYKNEGGEENELHTI